MKRLSSTDQNSNSLVNLPEPTNPQDAATKAYVDANAGGGGGGDDSTIVAAGRPDVPSTMDSATQAKVAAAPSGTEFRSTDGPQGAWVWMKQGSTWIVTSGNTGWINVPNSNLLNGWVQTRFKIARIDGTVYIALDYLRSGTANDIYNMPVGFYPMPGEDASLPIFAGNTRNIITVSHTTGVLSKNNTTAAPSGGGNQISYAAAPGWALSLDP